MRKPHFKDANFTVESEEDTEWELLVPERFKKVCTKDSWEPFSVPHTKEWY